MAARARRPRTNAEMSEATIAALVGHARREFGAKGYAASSVELIAHEVGLTKGAVYYHFRSKIGLFEAALRDCQHEIVRRIEARADATADPLHAIVAGCEAFLEVVMDSELRQVVLVDGPSVLGYTRWRRIDAEFGLGSLKDGLRAWTNGDETIDIDVLAQFVSGALNDLVLYVAESSKRKKTYERVRKMLPTLVSAVLHFGSLDSPGLRAARSGSPLGRGADPAKKRTRPSSRASSNPKTALRCHDGGREPKRGRCASDDSWNALRRADGSSSECRNCVGVLIRRT